MSDNEKDQMTSVIRRVETLAQCAQDRGVRLMVDAEQTYYQPAIRYITVDILMSKYNLSSPVIYNTQQCYLKVCVIERGREGEMDGGRDGRRNRLINGWRRDEWIDGSMEG